MCVCVCLQGGEIPSVLLIYTLAVSLFKPVKHQTQEGFVRTKKKRTFLKFKVWPFRSQKLRPRGMQARDKGRLSPLAAQDQLLGLRVVGGW